MLSLPSDLWRAWCRMIFFLDLYLTSSVRPFQRLMRDLRGSWAKQMWRKNVFFLERTGILILLLPSAIHCAELTSNRSDQWGSCSQLDIFFISFFSIFFSVYRFFQNGDPLWNYYGSVLLSPTEMTIDQYRVLVPLNRERVTTWPAWM